MPTETSSSSNTFTQEQLQNAASTYHGAVFDFYEGYTNTYNTLIQAGVDAQQASINGLGKNVRS